MRWAAAALATVSLMAQGHDEKPPPAAVLATTPHMAVIRAAPDFLLLDTENRPLRLSGLRGRTVLVAFIYTGCTSACPLLSWRMAQLQQKLAAARIPALLVSVTVDPERDDAKTLAGYARRFGARPGWHFVREEPARLAPVLAAYDEWARRDASGELDHPARLHLIDAEGRVREIYSLAFFDEEQAFLDIKALHKQTKPPAR
jgi:cytochrome oxidase Cu insertion factor (SCO1/SenC/PrrC family)